MVLILACKSVRGDRGLREREGWLGCDHADAQAHG